MSSSKNVLIEDFGKDYLRRLNRGDSPSIEEYINRHPEWATEIREFIEAYLVVDRFTAHQSDNQTSQSPTDPSFPDIPGYQIVRELGRGGMGIVYEARHVSLERDVALKVLSTSDANGEKSVERFLREAKSAGALHHTNIVPVFDVGTGPHSHFYAMQLIGGAPLNEVIAEIKRIRNSDNSTKVVNEPAQLSMAIAHTIIDGNGSFSSLEQSTAFYPKSSDESKNTIDSHSDFQIVAQPKRAPDSDTHPNEMAISDTVKVAANESSNYYKQVARIGRQVADALEHAHRKGIIHRDIKPANLILDLTANVWVTDFGLAKTEDDGLTKTGNIVGTMRYISPERFKGSVDPTTDIYALGVTLYEMLALRPIFDNSDRVSLVEKIQNSEPMPLKEIDPKIPIDLQTIVSKGIEKDPSHRYLTAQQLCDDLQRFLDGQPILARKISASERLGKWVQKNRTVAALLALVFVGLVTGIIASTLGVIAYREIAIRSKANEDRAVDAALFATQKSVEAQSKADEAYSINEFLNSDILGAADMMEGRVDREMKLVSVLNSAAQNVSRRFQDQPVIEGQLHRTMGRAYLSLGEFERAGTHLSLSHELLKEHLGPDHPDTLKSLFQLGRFHLESKGDVKLAKQILERIYEERTKRLGPDNRSTLRSAYELARLYQDTDQKDKSLPLLVGVYEGFRTSRGMDDRKTLRALVTLGRFHLENKEIAIARPDVELALKKTESFLGEQDMLTLNSRLNMAELEMISKNYEISLDLFDKNIDSAALWLGENHPVTIDFLQRLAFLYEDMGRVDDWLKTHQEAVNRIGMTYGENSRNHLDEKLNLVRQLRSYENQLDAAESLAMEVRELWVEKLGGENFKEVAIVDLNLGRVYEHQGKMESAKEYLEKASEVLPDDYKELRIAKLNLYMGLKEFAKARPIMAYEVELQNKQYGEQSMTAAKNHQYVSFLDEHLARIAKENGELEDAQAHLRSSEQRLRKSLTILKNHNPQGAAQIQEIHNVEIKLGFCLTNQGEFEDAIETLQPALEFDGWNDKSQWKHARAQGVRGEALTEMGKFDSAESALKKAQSGFDKFLNRKSDRISYNKKMATRFIKLYQAMNRSEQVSIWEGKLKEQLAQEAELLTK